MNMKQVRKKAVMMGIKPRKMKKTHLIHAIQTEEGNSPCFLTENDSCEQTDCCWRSDCLPVGSN